MTDSKCNWTILLLLAFAMWSNISKAQTAGAHGTSQKDVNDITPRRGEAEQNDTGVHNIDTSQTTPVKEMTQHSAVINVFPNPVKDYVTLVTDEVKMFEIINIQGVQVALVPANQKTLLAGIPPGFYLVRPIGGSTSTATPVCRLVKT